MFHDADIGIYGHRVQNVDIDVMARFQMAAAGLAAVAVAVEAEAFSS
jgi:hypothetical protein